MCRLAAFPPGTTAEEALAIVRPFSACNRDGVGTVYVQDGSFIVNKAPTTLDEALRVGVPLFDHMPYDGWTLFHIRLASHGKPLPENTHPFVCGEWAFAHNGVWHGYRLAQKLLRLTPRGQTDSEVAGMVWEKMGPGGYYDCITDGGVYMALRKDGRLYAYVTYGDLSYKKSDGGSYTLASTFVDKKDSFEVDRGWMKFASTGKLLKKRAEVSKYEKPKWSTMPDTWKSGSGRYDYTTPSHRTLGTPTPGGGMIGNGRWHYTNERGWFEEKSAVTPALPSWGDDGYDTPAEDVPPFIVDENGCVVTPGDNRDIDSRTEDKGQLGRSVADLAKEFGVDPSEFDGLTVAEIDAMIEGARGNTTSDEGPGVGQEKLWPNENWDDRFMGRE